MARRLLSDSERAAWGSWPDDANEDTVGAYFTLADGEAEELRRVGAPPVRLACALALAAIRWIGFVPQELAGAPPAGIIRLAEQLDVDPEVIDAYAPSERRAREHRRRAAQLARFSDAPSEEIAELQGRLVAESLQHDAPGALLRVATQTLHSSQRLRPGLSVLERLVAASRAEAERETHRRMSPLLDPQTRRMLDGLLATDPALKVSRVTWLGRESTSCTPAAIVGQINKLGFLRQLGADAWILEAVPANRRRHLAAVVRRSESQTLARRPDRVRYPALLCFCAEQVGRLVDEVLDRADEAIGSAHGRARNELERQKLATATKANEKVHLLELLLGLLLDPSVPDGELRTRAFAAMPVGDWEQARCEARQVARPVGDHHLAQLEARYAHLRRFTPRLLGALRFDAAPPAKPLLDAVRLLAQLNASGRRALPESAPAGFVPRRWRELVSGADGKLDRRQRELCALSELRTGQVWVEGSRRYQPADRYLIGADQWPKARPAALARLGLPEQAGQRLEEHHADIRVRVAALDQALSSGEVHVDLINDRLLVRRLPAEDRPTAATELAGIVERQLPFIDLTDLLIEVDTRTAFTAELGHAHGATPRHPSLRQQRFAALLALGCNLSYAEMGRAAKIDPQQLAYIAKWYLRPEALAAANSRIVDFHHGLELSKAWGDGRFSSSDGKRFPVSVKAGDARALSRYFGRGKGVTFYSWTSDQHAHYATRVVRTTIRDATYVLDGILDNQTELPIEKHTTDTAGYSDIIFALFDLLGLQFAPRLAGLPDTRLYHPGAPISTPAGRLLAHPIDTDLIRRHWDELTRCAASLREGAVTASLLVSRLQAAGRHLPLTRALQEYGRLIKTRFVLGYLTNPAERRAIGRQLNKAESLHALHDQIFHGRHGHVRLHTLDRQSTQAHALHLIANAVTTWNTLYTQQIIDGLPEPPSIDAIASLTPTISAHVNLLGTYHFNVDQLLHGLRPLRTAQRNGDERRRPKNPDYTADPVTPSSAATPSRTCRRPDVSLARSAFARSTVSSPVSCGRLGASRIACASGLSGSGWSAIAPEPTWRSLPCGRRWPARPARRSPMSFAPRRSRHSCRTTPEEATMFKDTKAFSGFSVNDIPAAKAFYGETLGIEVTENEMGILVLELAGGERPTIAYPKADHVPATFTIINFPSTDVGATVAALKAKGVEFETYEGGPMKADEDGVFRGQGPDIAWFKDPAGNVLSVIEDDGSDR